MFSELAALHAAQQAAEAAHEIRSVTSMSNSASPMAGSRKRLVGHALGEGCRPSSGSCTRGPFTRPVRGSFGLITFTPQPEALGEHVRREQSARRPVRGSAPRASTRGKNRAASSTAQAATNRHAHGTNRHRRSLLAESGVPRGGAGPPALARTGAQALAGVTSVTPFSVT